MSFHLSRYVAHACVSQTTSCDPTHLGPNTPCSQRFNQCFITQGSQNSKRFIRYSEVMSSKRDSLSLKGCQHVLCEVSGQIFEFVAHLLQFGRPQPRLSSLGGVLLICGLPASSIETYTSPTPAEICHGAPLPVETCIWQRKGPTGAQPEQGYHVKTAWRGEDGVLQSMGTTWPEHCNCEGRTPKPDRPQLLVSLGFGCLILPARGNLASVSSVAGRRWPLS